MKYQIPPAWAPIIGDYLTYITANGQRPATVELRHEQLARIARGLGTAPDAVTAEMLTGWFGHNAHWAAATRKSHREVVRGFFSWAYRTGRLHVDLADTIKPIRGPKPQPRPTPDDVYQRALDAADERVSLMIRLAAQAGLRRAEVSAVHTRDVLDGIDGAQLIVHGKGGKQRIVPVSDELARELRAGAAGYVFGSRKGDGEHLTPREVGMLVTAALPDGYTMHTLRHRFATRAYRGSRNLRAVQVLLGHESIVTTERYTAVDDDEIRAAAACAH